MNLIPHVKGAEEAFGIDCLHELRGTIGSIADELAAEILCDWDLVSASKALEQNRFEFAHDQERKGSDEDIIDLTTDYNVSSLLSNPNIGQRLRVRKYDIEVIANSVRVFSTRGVPRPDYHVKF